MKKIFTIAALMFVVFSVNAQKYMRYHMSDSTFFGFYTESVDSMMHTPSSSTVYMGGNLYEIPLDKVDSITFEGVSVYDENVIGKYRIYEIESDTLSYRKAYIDNRAMMIASRTGEFGANDTILVASEYYKTKWLIMTNNDGNVEKFFDGISLYYFDYHDDESFTVLHIEDSLFAPIDFYLENSVNKSRKQAKGIIANFNNKKFGKFVDDYYSEKYKEKFDGFNDALEGLMGFLEDIDNNPEFHNQKLILNGLEIGSDIWGVGSAVGGAFATGGLAWWLVLAEAGVLMNDINGLYEELYPNNEQMKIYTEYYQNKYNILARTEKAANITYSGATLKGTLTTLENQHGRVYFRYHKFQGLEDSKIVEATLTPMADGEWLIEAPVTDLKMNTTYLYYIVYECKVDGLNFRFISENSSEFTTHNLSLSDISAEDSYYDDGKVYYDMTATIESTKVSLANYKECGVYYRNKKTGKTYIEKKATFSGYSETSEVSFPFYVDKEDFDVINHSLHHARSSNYSFGVYVETQDGNHELYDEQDFDFEYDGDPKVYTGEVSSVSQTQATVKCEFEDCLFWDALRGVEYFTDTDSESLMLGANEEDGSHEFQLEDLTPNTTYNYRAYYEVDGVREYGETKSFETKGTVVKTGESSSVTANSAVVAGYAEGLESAESLCELGVCYSTSGAPSINNGKFVSSGRTSSGDFTVSLIGLKPRTTYYYVTLLAIDGEYFYGDVKSFETKDAVVETGEASSVTANSAVVSGYAEGLESAENHCELGVCYSTSGTPSINNGKFVSSDRMSSGDFTVLLTALKLNTIYYYVACLAIDGEYFYGDVKTFETKGGELCDDGNHVHAVDLGLSVKWACCNVGSSVPEDYGGYYAWGETEEKSDYYWDTYKYNIDTDGDGYKECQNIGSNISGTSYDVAHVKWGGGWRMPTLDEIKELCNKCSWELTSVNDVHGYKVTGPNGNSIFLPAVGYRYGTEVYDRGSRGDYWSGTLYEDNSYGAYNLYFDVGYGYNRFNRSDGRAIRPVTE